MTLPFLSCPALGGCGDPGDPIDFALQAGGAGVYLSRVHDTINRKQATFDFEVRLLAPGTNLYVYATRLVGSQYFLLGFSGGVLQVGCTDWPSGAWATSERLFRDPGAWYHFHVEIDTTQAVASDRVRVWVNGQQTVMGGARPPLDSDLSWYGAGQTHYLGWDGSASTPGGATSHNLARLCWQDAIRPVSEFGYFNSHGAWVRRPPPYGLGMVLDFADPLNLGKDVSGNGNHWTPVNLTAANQVTDTPTHPEVLLNPVRPQSGTLSGGNLSLDGSTAYAALGQSVMRLPYSGRYYLEAWVDSWTSASEANMSVGLISANGNVEVGYLSRNGGTFQINQPSAGTLGSGDAPAWWSPAGGVLKVGLRLDLDNALYGTVSPAGVASPIVPLGNPPHGGWYLALYDRATSYRADGTINVGGQTFAHGLPDGYDPVAAAQLECPDILNPDDWFTIRRKSGGAGVDDMPWDPTIHKTLVVSKREDTSASWQMVDTVSGAGFAWESDDAAAGVAADPNGLTAFTPNGYTVGTSTPWQGTRTDEIYRAGRRSGFDIVTINHVTGSASTVLHAAGEAIDYAWVVRMDAGADRRVYHRGMSAGQYLRLNSVSGPSTDAGWFTSTANDVTLGAGMPSGTYRLYVWRAVPQFSAFPTYSGNGVADGPMLLTDFAPRKIDTHRLDGSGNWYCLLPPVAGGNPAGVLRYYEVPAVPAVGAYADLNSNGTKIRNSDGSWNTSGSNIMAAMWAAATAKFARAR